VNPLPTPENDPSSIAELERSLSARFHRDAGVGAIGHPVVAAVLVFLVRDSVSLTYGLLGAGAVVLASLVRIAIHRSAEKLADDPAAQLRRTRWSTSVVAAVWGVIAILLLPLVPAAAEGRILMVYAGLVAAGIATHQADSRGFNRFTAFLLGPVLIGLFLAGADGLLAVDVLFVVAFWAMMTLLQKRTHAQLRIHLATGLELSNATERATREKEFVTAVLAGAPDGMVVLAPDGHVTRTSREFQRLLGMSEEELKGLDPAQQEESLLWQAIAQLGRDARSEGRSEQEIEVPHAGGAFTYHLTAAPGHGAATGWVVLMVEDFTPLREAQEAYSEVVEAAHDLIWKVDVEGNWTFLNSAANDIYGAPPEELLGTSVFDRAPEDRRDADRKALEALMGGAELLNRETVHHSMDGTSRTLSFSARPIYSADGEIVGAQGVARDVTDQVRGREALEELARNTLLLTSLINASQDLIFYKDADCVYRGCNEAFAAFVGFTEEELVGRSDYELYDAERADRFVGSDRRAMDSAAPVRYEEWVELDGEKRLFETVKTAVPGPDGLAAGVLGIVRDVTERQRAEDQMRALAQEAERTTRMKSAFLANMSHEIRTPMNGVLGMTELVLDTDLTDEQRQYLQVAQSSGRDLLRILNDILDFSKIEAGRLELESIPFDLPESLGDATRLLGPAAAKRGDELALDIDPDVGRWYSGDAVRMRQIVTNLVSNAVKFTRDGEVVVSASRIGGDEGRHHLRIAVRDTGVGIPKDKLDSIFGEFSQADSSVSRNFGGTGLGLAICRRLVELMGGQIGVESVEGGGSTFAFEIPLAPVEAPAESKAPDPEWIEETRILIVDDNPTNRRILSAVYREAGADVVGVASAVEGLRALEATSDRPFDLIITDVQMPEMDGITFIEKVREGSQSQLPILVLSSTNLSEDARRARDLGVVGYHLKPLPRADLLAVAAGALGARKRVPRRVTDPASKANAAGTLASEALPKASAPGKDGSPPADGAARVLLVEDNPVNRQVALAVLQKSGYEVISAENGQEAVDLALSEPDIGAVLMDVQMPVMDGIEATRVLREDPRTRSLPIIALTAHALPEERERCLNAGMNDFLPKPFQADDLRAALDRWIAGARTAAVAGGSAPSQRPPSDAPVDMVQLRETMIEAGVEDVIPTLLSLFMQEMPERRAAIAESSEAGDFDALRDAAHSLKSSAGNIRANRLHILLKDLELAAREEDADAVAEISPDALEEIDRVSDFLNGSA